MSRTSNDGTAVLRDDRDPRLGRMPSSVVDPKGGGSRARNVLVVATTDDVPASLRAHIGADDVVKVVVPVVGQGPLDWLANDEKAFSHAQEVAATTAEQLPGEPVDAGAGDANVDLAIRDALATFPADEILVAVDASDATAVDALGLSDAGGSSGRRIADVPVRIVTVTDR